MNKTELSKIMAARMSVSRNQAQLFIETLGEVFEISLSRGESITLQGFGTFSLWKQTERLGRNPRVGAPVLIRARNSVKFKPGKLLLEVLNQKDKQIK